jgi:hypothetical protein
MRRDLIHCLLLLALFAAGKPLLASADARGLPPTLRATGLFDDSMNRHIIEFAPQFPLWSDGASKRRWIQLPPGSFIDARNPDAWEFPRGTKLWKEFAHGAALETRYIERGVDGQWRFGSYVWNAEGTEAVLAPAVGIREIAAPRAPGGHYTIPAENDCRACHEGAPVPVLGFSALQISGDLRPLAKRGLIRNLPVEWLENPPRIASNDPRERAALGYLHGNCGHCHNDDGPLAVLEMNLSQRASQGFDPGAVMRSILAVPSQVSAAGAPRGTARLAPGHFSGSAIAVRMRSRDPLQQMPPLGTSRMDASALALLADWTDGLSRK